MHHSREAMGDIDKFLEKIQGLIMETMISYCPATPRHKIGDGNLLLRDREYRWGLEFGERLSDLGGETPERDLKECFHQKHCWTDVDKALAQKDLPNVDIRKTRCQSSKPAMGPSLWGVILRGWLGRRDHSAGPPHHKWSWSGDYSPWALWSFRLHFLGPELLSRTAHLHKAAV